MFCSATPSSANPRSTCNRSTRSRTDGHQKMCLNIDISSCCQGPQSGDGYKILSVFAGHPEVHVGFASMARSIRSGCPDWIGASDLHGRPFSKQLVPVRMKTISGRESSNCVQRGEAETAGSPGAAWDIPIGTHAASIMETATTNNTSSRLRNPKVSSRSQPGCSNQRAASTLPPAHAI